MASRYPDLSFIRRRSPASPPLPQDPARRVCVEWRDESAQKLSQPAILKPGGAHGFTVVVAEPPPPDAVVQVREESSSYPAEVLSVTAVPEGVELHLDYLWEGRRREGRASSKGPAVLKPDGLPRIPVEVMNISSTGMQLFAQQSAPVGSAARVFGEDSEHLGLVRYCAAAAGGYRIGVQFYGETRKEEPDAYR